MLMKNIRYRAVSTHMLEKMPITNVQVASKCDVLIDKTSYGVGLKIFLKK